MKNEDELENNDDIQIENKQNIKKPKANEGILNDDAK
jgi:hypothetical protein